MENIVEKGEIAHFEQFHPFPQCFPKTSLQCVKMSKYGGKGSLKVESRYFACQWFVESYVIIRRLCSVPNYKGT